MNIKKIKKINPQKKIYIITAIFLSVYLMLGYFLLLPGMEEIKNIRNEVLKEKIEMENKINREKNMAKLNDDLKQVEGEVGLLSEIFINKNKELEFITLMEGIASENNVQQNLNLNIEKTDKRTHYSKVPLDMIIKGSHKNVLSYLKDIERLKYYINIHNLSLSVNTAEDDSGKALNASAQINSETFWQ